ncbi:MAG: arginine--tRNA ligase [Parcubacteria group bacterium]|nr:arginine--tRNA ligase [Parcubacteria group bacterium]
MDIKQTLFSLINDSLKSLDLSISPEKIVFEHPTELSHGDYSCNVALGLSKEQKIAPRELADKIVANIEKIPLEVEKIEVAGPGFINFYLSKKFFVDNIAEILKKEDDYGKNKNLKGEKTIIEYTNTNVLKPLHIGHLMGNVIGESLSRVLEWNGAKLKRNTYQGDVGLHIAKALWGITKLKSEMPASGLSEQIQFLGRAYAYGASAYEDNKDAQAEIKEINKKLFEGKDEELERLYMWARNISLAHFEELYKKLGTKFDYYFFESEVEKDALVIVKKFLTKGVFEESDGAIVFKGEKYDPKLHTRVFVNSQGIPTYEAKDIAHAIRKYKKFHFDNAIIITANEQNDYFKVVLKALELTYPEIAQKTKHLSHGMLKLTSGKMSSRDGNVITGESLIYEMEEEVFLKMKGRNFNDNEKGKIAEDVGVASIKYSILRQSVGKDIIFDPEKSISFEGDSGPYLQYAYTRASSVLQKAKTDKMKASVKKNNGIVSDLEKILYRFPEVVDMAGKEYLPSGIVTYLTELAGTFNSFYAKTKIIDKENVDSPYRIALTKAFVMVMGNGLYLLGIKVPEKM